MTIGERFREIRKLSDRPNKKCSQADFGEMFKIGRDAVANIENGRVEPSELLVESVCNRFSVSYDWLRYGLEPMRAAKSDEEEVADYVAQALNGSGEFKKAVIKMICTRSEEDLKALERSFMDIYESLKKEKGQD